MIFKSKKIKHMLGDTTIQHECDYCKNTVIFNAHRIEGKMTLLNKPLYTTYKTSYIVCPICNQKKEISEKELKKHLIARTRIIRL